MEMHLIGNAHIDPVWLWRWQQGYAEVQATFQSALDRMEEFPDYIFTSACGCYYKWIEDTNPEMFEKIRLRVAEGRWEIAGGMWIQPDCNIPSGESFARQMLYTQQYFYEKFGKIATVGYNVDSFGHNNMLPQLLRLGGMDSYVFMRPDALDDMSFPGRLFNWYSPDGSFVTAFRVPISYGMWMTPEDILLGDEDKPDGVAKLNAMKKLAEEENIPMMCFYGVGNHGGGPTIAILKNYEEQIKSDPGMKYSTPARYFESVRPLVANLPRVETGMQHHASGCYSAHSAIKLANRMSERRLVLAEKLMSSAHALLGTPYDRDGVTKGWERLLFNQFHDALGGCSIKPACEDAMEAFGFALDSGAKCANLGMRAIAWNVDTSGGLEAVRSKGTDWMLWEREGLGTPLIVFNPHSQAVTAPVIVNKELRGLTDNGHKPVKTQRVRGQQTNQNDVYNTLFLAELPPMGYRLFWLFRETELCEPVAEPATARENVLENKYVRLTFDRATGWIASMTDKQTGRDLLSGDGAVPVAIDESHTDTWAHNVYSFHKEIGRFSNATLEILERGPVYAAVRVTSRFHDSVLRQDFRLHCESREVEVAVRLNFNERHTMLKLVFPANVKDAKAVLGIPYGFISMETTGTEEAMQGFVAAAGENAVAILSSGKYSADLLGNRIGYTIARSPGYAENAGARDNQMEFQDQGVQEFRYWIAWQDKTNIGDFSRASLRLQEEPVSVLETYHKGKLPEVFGGCEISSPYVAVTAFKRAEKLPGYIVRAVEIRGEGIEQVVIGLPVLSRSVTADFGPQEIKTFYIPDDESAPVKELNLIEM